MDTRTCQNCKTDFQIEPDDFSFYEKMKVPVPTRCPLCRMVRRLSFRNERNLFRRKDAHTGKDSFSGFPVEANINTYENQYWYGDEWDALTYGMEYDFSKSFFEQFYDLLSRVPLPAKSSAGFMESSDYCNEAGRLRNAYLCFDADFIENSAYLVKGTNMKDSFDSHEVIDDELCYEDVMVYKSFRTFYSLDCESCVDVWFSKGLRGCTNCFGCVNLKGKSYHFFNEPLSKDEYEKRIAELDLGSYGSIAHIRTEILKFWQQFPVKYYHGIRNLIFSGERISDSKNVLDSVSIQEGENLRYCQIGLSKKQYCILNKQYTKEEYFTLRDAIIKQMNETPYKDITGREHAYGEFFPAEFSPIAYNESLAQDYVPLDREQAKERGFAWREPNAREFQTTILAGDLPDAIADVSDDILKEVIACENCKRAYRIIPIELQFYKRIGLPVPHKCHNCRFLDRYTFINKPKLYHRSCMNEGCLNEFETSYAPTQPDIVYCETCYQREVL